MRFIADLHIHSHYSRATSRDLVPEKLALWAQKKGIHLLGTGDFTHPGWVAELKENLVEAEQGLFRLRPDLEKRVENDLPQSCRSSPRFILSGELSCIYKKGGKTRKVHHLILMPDFDSLEKFNKALGRIGNIRSDGRPILGLDSKNLLEMVLEASDKGFFIPAHIWTPWFSLFGSKSGFDTIEECFEELTCHIHALETGLSSDPAMNGLFSALDGYVLVSNSDAHSPAKLGREANLFDVELDYDHVVEAMTGGGGFLGTIEFFPEEGKYHLDGHRKCGVCFEPEETNHCSAICPKCGKPLTVGVLNRVCELADRDTPVVSRDFHSLIPFPEILSEILSCGPATNKVTSAYEDLLERLGPELHILMDCSLEELKEAGGPLLAEGIRRMRLNQVIRDGGYDGEYGKIRLFQEDEKSRLAGQFGLFPTGRKAAPPSREREEHGAGKTRPTRKAVLSFTPSGTDPILDPLNPEQKEAVLHERGHLLIIAGPGTGKTMTLTHRIAFLVREGVDPSRVLALTFTNKAAREMEGRIRSLAPGEGSLHVRVSTFHRFCMNVLRGAGERSGVPPDFILCSQWDSEKIAERVGGELNLKSGAIRAFLKHLPRLKRESLLDETPDPSMEQMLPLFHAYRQRLRESRMLDLDDLELETYRLFRASPEILRACADRAQWIFVDEYQDTDPIEAAILRTLVSPESHPYPAGHEQGGGRICAIGDPDQAIYGFRGAEVRSFHAFQKDYPGATVVSLVRNYRSTQTILNGAATILQKEKPLKGQNGHGDPILTASCRTAEEEAEMVVSEIERLIGGISHFSLDSGRVSSHEEGEGGYGFGDIAVLFRLNAQGEKLEEALQRSGIPYVRSGEKPLVMQHPVHTLWRFLLAAAYPKEPHYRELYLALPGIEGKKGKTVLRSFSPNGPVEEVVQRAAEIHSFNVSNEETREPLRRLLDLTANFAGNLKAFLDLLSMDRGIDHQVLAGDRVALMSLHAAKGLEWPFVFITGCEEGLLPCTIFGEMDEEEEKRLFYVGMTRARKTLFLSHAKSRILSGRTLQSNPSPFLTLIPEGLWAPLARPEWKTRKKTNRQLDLF
ncbi:MAG: hypothetical protein CVU64_15415 [Deltaproteobacteria bacterium HGW-Deltaproteobacteria-21]|nr:MAG: hypothetical protein CVU64_15415 [Deltaproteobacteria bacterium HGW-Deltaproteobacteria-21]